MRRQYRLKELLRESSTQLSRAAIANPMREAQLLFCAYFNKDELWIITHQESLIDVDEAFFHWIERRAANEPFEYICNQVSFYSEMFYVDAGALIPRPETELLVDEVLKNITDKQAALEIVEVGVGSGVISIMLAKFLPNAKFIAVDISKDALRVATKNIEHFGLAKRIELREGSLLDAVDEKIDYLVSNPPYIAFDAPLESNLAYEPQNALFGGSVGDEIIQKLLDEVLSREIKFFSCEMGYDQKDKIQNYLKNKKYRGLSFYKDYSNFDRGFTLKV
jgi:release factor glutamine methyltransferase